LTRKNTSQVTGQPVFASGKKIGFGSSIFRVGLENSNPFCHVYVRCNVKCCAKIDKVTF